MDGEADRAAIEALVTRAYAVISGPPGAPRDWEGMRALYWPDARLTALRADGPWSGSVEDYIERGASFLTTSGFAESALVNRVLVFGDIAHAWSSYSGDWTEEDGSAGKTRGINSFQLRREPGGAWRIHSLLWQVENPAFPLPAEMEAPR